MAWLMNTKTDRALLTAVVTLIDATTSEFETTRYDIKWSSSGRNVYRYQHLRQVCGDIEIRRPVDTFLGVQQHLVTIGEHEIVPSRIYRMRIRKAFERREIRAASVSLSERLIGADTKTTGIDPLLAG